MKKRTGLAIALAVAVAAAVGATYALAGSSGGGPGPRKPIQLPAKPERVVKITGGPKANESKSKVYFAVVNANGDVVASRGVDEVDHFADGIYGILFSNNVGKCALQVTVGNNGDSEPYDGVPGYSYDGGKKTNVVVATVFWQPTQEYYDGDFTIVATC
jgi:hypothetical protein